jgi:hemerythrin-like domain-containing protein
MTEHLATEPPADDPVTPPLPDHVSVVLAGHRAFRRDTARFIKALGQVDAEDRTTIAGLVAWFDAATEALHHHHVIEDEIFWPALRQRSPAFVAMEQLLQDEHEALDAAIGEAVATVRALDATDRPGWEPARRAAEEAVVRMRAILVEHLTDEEAHALPLLGEAFTPQEFGELDRKVTELFDPRELGFGACWYLDAASPEEHAVIWAGLPLPLRVLYRLHLHRSYLRVSAVLPAV